MELAGKRRLRQGHNELTAFAGMTCGADVAAVHLDDAVDDGQAQADPALLVLGGVEGLERVAGHVGGIVEVAERGVEPVGEVVDTRLERQPACSHHTCSGAAEVEVEAGTSELILEPSKLTLRTRELTHIPPVAEADLFRAVQSLPGVSTLSDFSSGLYVRGGSADHLVPARGLYA